VQEVKAYSAWRPDRYGAKFIFFLGPTSSSSWGGVKDCSGSEPDNPPGIPPHSPLGIPPHSPPPAQLPASSPAPFEPVPEPVAAQEELLADSYNSQATTLVMGPATARVLAPEATDEDAKSESSKPSEILELCGEVPLDLACFESFSRLPSHFVTETVNAARVLATFTITWATCFSGSDIAKEAIDALRRVWYTQYSIALKFEQVFMCSMLEIISHCSTRPQQIYNTILAYSKLDLKHRK
jgi:hypothetical protein